MAITAVKKASVSHTTFQRCIGLRRGIPVRLGQQRRIHQRVKEPYVWVIRVWFWDMVLEPCTCGSEGGRREGAEPRADRANFRPRREKFLHF